MSMLLSSLPNRVEDGSLVRYLHWDLIWAEHSPVDMWMLDVIQKALSK